MNIIHIAELNYELCNGIKTVITALYLYQKRLGHTVFVLNLIDNKTKIFKEEYYIYSSTKFQKTINQIKPDIVVFHSIYKLPYFGFANYLVENNIPYLIEPHGGTTIENQKKSYWKKKLANILWANKFIEKASAVIYLNQKELENCIFTSKRKESYIIPNGVTTPLSFTSSRDSKIRFIFLARLNIHHKGLDLLIHAIQHLCNKGYTDKFEFHFYGEADSTKEQFAFEQLFANIKKTGNIFYHGMAINEKKEMAFKNSDIYVLTSRYEGMPMSVLEALSHGIPCVITPQTNMQKIIEDNECGWITDLDSNTIAQTLIMALDEFPKRKKTLNENARKATLPYTWETIAKQTISIYQTVIKGNN